MIEFKFTCDCGCGQTIGNPKGWIIVRQFDGQRNDDLKIDGVLHFMIYECLRLWIDSAMMVLPGLQERARGLNPRGRLVDKRCPTVYF